jgi:probable rRNA maturation factor
VVGNPRAIYLRNTTRKHHLSLRKIEKTVKALLLAVGEPQATLSISFVGDAAIRRLNKEHRGKNRPTDVLSFPLYNPLEVRRKNNVEGERLLGDIIVSVDTAVRQAAEYGATLTHEIERLLIHGLLHLMGYDHEKPGERRRMEAEERRLAAVIGMRWPFSG